MNKTVYIRDEDAAIWEKARELAGDKLSPIIVSLLARYVTETEAFVRDYERIEVRYEDSDANHLPKAKRFYGSWIFPPGEPFDEFDDEGEICARYAIAVTMKGSAVVYWWRVGHSGGKWNEKFHVFASLEDAAKNNDINFAVRQAIQKRGVPTEELDI